MNAEDLIANDARIAVCAEQEVIGALLLDNDAIDCIPDLLPEHFYRADNRAIFAELRRQIGRGMRADPLGLLEPLRGKVEDCMRYLSTLRSNCGSAATIRRHADMVLDKAMKREMIAIGRELETSAIGGATPAEDIVGSIAARLDDLVRHKCGQDPMLLSDMLASYATTIERRMSGEEKPVAIGFADLDYKLGGGLERGTLTVIAGRPGMGKSALGLALARNVAAEGTALFLSLEMSVAQINDRNVAALGHIPINWLRKPSETGLPGSRDEQHWNGMTAAFGRAAELDFHIDAQAGLNMLAIRSKARRTKRKTGRMNLLVIDQLSFINGAQSEKSYEQIGEYTRGLIALAKELDCPVVLLAQLNRQCESRTDKRPMLSDLAQSGSIEQDAANVIFLYRDEVYNPDSQDKGTCEIIIAKQRQGQTGTVGLTYVPEETRFENLAHGWHPAAPKAKPRRGFGDD